VGHTVLWFLSDLFECERLVLSVQQTNGGVTLQTAQASLFDVFRTAQLGAAAPSSGGTSSIGTESLHPSGLPTGEFTILPTFSEPQPQSRQRLHP
jgi:hypothetical protein